MSSRCLRHFIDVFFHFALLGVAGVKTDSKLTYIVTYYPNGLKEGTLIIIIVDFLLYSICEKKGILCSAISCE